MVVDLENREAALPLIERALGKEIPLDMELSQLKRELEEAGLDEEMQKTFGNLLEMGTGKKS